MGLIRDLMKMYSSIKDPDKEKGDNMLEYYAKNPSKYQELADSSISDNPQMLQQIFGQNARFGGNSNAVSQIQNNIQSTPLSDLAKAQRLEDFQSVNPNDIANASVALPQMRAYNGMSQNQFQQQEVPKIIDNANNKAGLLNQDQQDMLSKSRGGKSGLDTKLDISRLNLTDAETVNALHTADEYNKTIGGRAADSDSKVRNNAATQAADSALESYFTSHPESRAKKLTDIFRDKTVDPDVRTALPMSSKYGDRFKIELADDAEQERLRLQREANNISRERKDEWLPKLIAANALSDYSKFGGDAGVKGFMDLYNQQDTPEAAAARATMSQGTPQMKSQAVAEYNKTLLKIQDQVSKGKSSPDAIDANLSVLNALGTRLSGMGIDRAPVVYGESQHKSIGQSIHDHLPLTQVTRTLQTADGGEPTAAVYDSKKDAGLLTNQKKVKDDLSILQEKSDLFNNIKKSNPNLPDNVVQARVEAEYNKTHKKP